MFVNWSVYRRKKLEKFQDFLLKWYILFWKAVLIRKHCILVTVLEFVVPIVFCLQIKLMFQPMAYQYEHLESHAKEDIINTFPSDVECAYAPKNPFVDSIMSQVSAILGINVEASDSEEELVLAYYSKRPRPKSIWAIFDVNSTVSQKPEKLKYKIRSSEIGENAMTVMRDEEPAIVDPYVETGFMALQMAIERVFVEMWKHSRLPPIGEDIRIGRYPSYKMDFLVVPTAIRPNITLIYYMFVVAFLFPSIATLQKMIYEKEIGFTALMELMNMSFAVMYFGWVHYLMFTVLPVTTICTMLLSPVFDNHPKPVIFLFILLYILMFTFFVFVVGTFFAHSIRAVLTSLSLWLFLTHFTIVLDEYLVTASFWLRIASLILPHSGLLYGIVAFTSGPRIDDYLSESLKEFLQSNNLPAPPQIVPNIWSRQFSDILTLRYIHDIIHVREKVAVWMVLLAWALHIIFWYFLAIYFDLVESARKESGKLWYYFCKFRERPEEVVQTMLRGSTNWSKVEQIPTYIKSSIRLRSVTKKFDQQFDFINAVNEVTIDFYQNEFNVILGSNGSGKTTLLKLIVGLYKPTYGNIYVEGRDFYEQPPEGINIFGYCPQDNILVNYMTPLQHLYMCGMMHGMTYYKAYTEARKILKKLGLDAIRNEKVKEFSFGTKRRICLGMSLMGDTKILILDEPTYGVDPEYRRQMMDIFMEIRRTKTVLLATNSMEAADVLADRITIIANGKIECFGSKMYLNRRYGIGYVLSILSQEYCDVDNLREEIQEFSPDPITLRSITGLVVRFDVSRNSRFTKLLRYLESNKEELKIASVTLSAAGIESQFLRIGIASQLKERNIRFRGRNYELLARRRRKELLLFAKPWKRLSGRALCRQQVVIMFYKKFLHMWSSSRFYLSSILAAVMTLLLTITISELSNYALFEVTEVPINVVEYVENNNLHVLLSASNDQLSRSFVVALYSTGKSYSKLGTFHVLKEITAAELMIHPALHSLEFRDNCLMSVDVFANGTANLMYSSAAVHSGPIALNFVNNALLHYYCGSDNCRIELVNRPLVDPRQWQHRLVHPRSVRNWENAAVIATTFLLLPTIDLTLKESNSFSKLLQMNTWGMSAMIYWAPVYVMDLLIYAISLLILCTMFLFTYSKTQFTSSDIVPTFGLFVCYGACMIPLGYCAQLFTKKQERVYLIIIVVNITALMMVNGSLVLPLLFRISNDFIEYLFELLLHTLPPYVLTCALSNYVILNLYNVQCREKHTCNTKLYVEDPCCQNDQGRYHKPLNAMLVKQSGQTYYHSVVDDMLLLISEAFLFSLVLHIFERKNRRKWYYHVESSTENDDIVEPSVIEEKEQVKRNMEAFDEMKRLPPNVALTVQRIKKCYGRQVALRGVNFNIHRQECFGLLGLNGAGKTTIFNILTGHITMNSGRSALNTYDFFEDQDKFIGSLGYCPQMGGLNDFMTGRQYLILHAALRGVPFRSISDEVNKWLDVLDLLDFESLQVRTYPWGVQRKFTILQSLVGDLPIILLDEPSSGIDVIARHTMCDVLYQVREMGRSLLISTHNMQEAQALCFRVGILVDGQFTAIDSCENLKREHGNNFIMSISVVATLNVENLTKIKDIIDEEFPGIQLTDSYMGVLKYELDSRIPYSNVFDTLERLRQKYAWITDFTVNQPSMDQVFFDLASRRNR